MQSFYDTFGPFGESPLLTVSVTVAMNMLIVVVRTSSYPYGLVSAC
jgi:hypothetical protein